MTDLEIYAQQMANAREAEYRTPEFRHRVALVTTFRGLLKKNRSSRS